MIKTELVEVLTDLKSRVMTIPNDELIFYDKYRIYTDIDNIIERLKDDENTEIERYDYDREEKDSNDKT